MVLMVPFEVSVAIFVILSVYTIQILDFIFKFGKFTCIRY